MSRVLFSNSISPPNTLFHLPCLSFMPYSHPPCWCRSVANRPIQTVLDFLILVVDRVSPWPRLLCPHKMSTASQLLNKDAKAVLLQTGCSGFAFYCVTVRRLIVSPGEGNSQAEFMMFALHYTLTSLPDFRIQLWSLRDLCTATTTLTDLYSCNTCLYITFHIFYTFLLPETTGKVPSTLHLTALYITIWVTPIHINIWPVIWQHLCADESCFAPSGWWRGKFPQRGRDCLPVLITHVASGSFLPP